MTASSQPSFQPSMEEQGATLSALQPMYSALVREFVIEVSACPVGEEFSPSPESVQQAEDWFEQVDAQIQVHQLRQFLQTSALVNQEGLVSLLQHYLAKTARTDAIRDKIDFLLVQYFSQLAPSGVTDADVDLAYVAQALEPVLGKVEMKPPVWLNALDRVLEASRRWRSLDELLHGGVLEQGRKAKGLAGDLFYLPVALAAFTRFGYLMRRSFFRLMLGDLNTILDGLTELEDKGIETIDCRRAQFSAQEPIIRLRMICQSWKVMFQAEYSSGQPLRMLVDLRASVEYALGRGKAPEAEVKAKAGGTAKPAPATKPASTPMPAAKLAAPVKPAPVAAKAVAAAASAGASRAATKAVAPAGAAALKPKARPGAPKAEAPEFEVSGTPGWDSDSTPEPGTKK